MIRFYAEALGLDREEATSHYSILKHINFSRSISLELFDITVVLEEKTYHITVHHQLREIQRLNYIKE